MFGCSDDHSIGRVAQYGTKIRHFFGDINGDRENLKDGVCFQLVEQFVHAELGLQRAVSEQHCHLNQSDGTDRYRLAAVRNFIQYPCLLPGESLGVREPAKQNVSIEQDSRGQRQDSRG